MRVQNLTVVIAFCSLETHFTLKLPLSTREFNAGGNPAMDYIPIQVEEEASESSTETGINSGGKTTSSNTYFS